MPLFFLVSGYLFSVLKYKNDINRLIKEKTHYLLVPYVSFWFVGSSIWLTLRILSDENVSIMTPLIGLFYGNGAWIVGNDPIWFLACLFCSFFVFNFVLKLVQKYDFYMKTLIFFVIGSCGYIAGNLIWLPFSFDIALVAIMFMYIGNVLKEKKVLYNNKYMIIITSISAIFLTLALYFNTAIDMNTRSYGHIIWFYIGGFSGSMIIFFIAKYILAKTYFIKKIFSYMGKESIIILGFHMSIGFYFVNVLELILNINLRQNSLATTILSIGLALFLAFIINRVSVLSLLFKGKPLSSQPSKILTKQNVA